MLAFQNFVFIFLVTDDYFWAYNSSIHIPCRIKSLPKKVIWMEKTAPWISMWFHVKPPKIAQWVIGVIAVIRVVIGAFIFKKTRVFYFMVFYNIHCCIIFFEVTFLHMLLSCGGCNVGCGPSRGNAFFEAKAWYPHLDLFQFQFQFQFRNAVCYILHLCKGNSYFLHCNFDEKSWFTGFFMTEASEDIRKSIFQFKINKHNHSFFKNPFEFSHHTRGQKCK